MSRNLKLACLLVTGIVFVSCSKETKAPSQETRASISATSKSISYISETYTTPSVAAFSMRFVNSLDGKEYILSTDRVDTGYGYENGQVSISQTNLVDTAISTYYDANFENTFAFNNIRTAKITVTLNDDASNDDAQGFKSITATLDKDAILYVELTALFNYDDVSLPYKANKTKAAVFVDKLGKQLNDYSSASGTQPLPVHIRIDPR